MEELENALSGNLPEANGKASATTAASASSSTSSIAVPMVLYPGERRVETIRVSGLGRGLEESDVADMRVTMHLEFAKRPEPGSGGSETLTASAVRRESHVLLPFSGPLAPHTVSTSGAVSSPRPSMMLCDLAGAWWEAPEGWKPPFSISPHDEKDFSDKLVDFPSSLVLPSTIRNASGDTESLTPSSPCLVLQLLWSLAPSSPMVGHSKERAVSVEIQVEVVKRGDPTLQMYERLLCNHDESEYPPGKTNSLPSELPVLLGRSASLRVTIGNVLGKFSIPYSLTN